MSKQASNRHKVDLLNRIHEYINDIKQLENINLLSHNQSKISLDYQQRVLGMIEAARLTEVLNHQECDDLINIILNINK